MTRDVLNEQVKVYLMKRALEVLEWYITGDVVDCAETRKNINRDLMSVLKETERKFKLKPFKRVLRVHTVDPGGIVNIRWEDRDLS